MQISRRRRQGFDRVIVNRPAATGPTKLVSSQLPISESPRSTPLAPKPQSATPGVKRKVTVSPRRSTPVVRGRGSKQDIWRPSSGVKSTSMLERTRSPLVTESVSRSRPRTSLKEARCHRDGDPAGARTLSSRKAIVHCPATDPSGKGFSPPAAGARAVRQPPEAATRPAASHPIVRRLMQRPRPTRPRRPRSRQRRSP